jgi:hypothetical protein
MHICAAENTRLLIYHCQLKNPCFVADVENTKFKKGLFETMLGKPVP